jgi:hypothetical protein
MESHTKQTGKEAHREEARPPQRDLRLANLQQISACTFSGVNQSKLSTEY